MKAVDYRGDSTLMAALAIWERDRRCPFWLQDWWLDQGEEEFTEAAKLAAEAMDRLSCDYNATRLQGLYPQILVYPVFTHYGWYGGFVRGPKYGHRPYSCNLPFDPNVTYIEYKTITDALLGYFDLYIARIK